VITYFKAHNNDAIGHYKFTWNSIGMF